MFAQTLRSDERKAARFRRGPGYPARVSLRAASLLAALALVVAGCGKTQSPDAQVKSVIERYATASAKHDYQAICDDLVAPVLANKVEQIGLPCELAFKRGLSAVSKPTITVGLVRIIGATAYAQIHSAAANEAPSDDTMRLVKVGGDWRIAALSARMPQAVQPPPPANPAPSDDSPGLGVSTPEVEKPAPEPGIPPGAIPTG